MYFIQPPHTKNEWWRYIMSIFILGVIVLVFGSIPIIAISSYKVAKGEPVDLNEFSNTYDFKALGIESSIGLILMLFPFVLGFIGLLITNKLIHNKEIGYVFSAFGKIRWKRFFTAILIGLILFSIAEVIIYLLNPSNYILTFDATTFFPILLITVLIIPLQAGFEEMFFRGYLMQGVGNLFNSRLLALLITSVGFGLLHLSNPEIDKYGVGNTLPFYIVFGILAGIIVIMDNGLELAWGLHTINNIYSSLVVSFESSVIDTGSIFRYKEFRPMQMNIAFIIVSILFIIIISRIYQWENWKKVISPIKS